MCETRDLGIKRLHWHTLIFEGEVRVDMRYVCPKDVKKMLLQRARTVHWKKWAAIHEYEELKEGIWLETAGSDYATQETKVGLKSVKTWPAKTFRHWLVG